VGALICDVSLLMGSSYKQSVAWPSHPRLTRRSHVIKAVKNDLRGYFHVEETRNFLERLLPVEQKQVDALFNLTVKWNLYNEESKRWTKWPTKPKLEEEIYGPFVEIANAISGHADPQKGSYLKGQWHDVHSKTPESMSVVAPLIRPDVVFISNSSNAIDLQKKIDNLQKQKGQKKADRLGKKSVDDSESANGPLPADIKKV
jgi:hypothetical protein